jgi:hypothetical protein
MRAVTSVSARLARIAEADRGVAARRTVEDRRHAVEAAHFVAGASAGLSAISSALRAKR